MSNRPDIDASVSSTTKAALLAIQDIAEAIEDIYVDLQFLDELGKVQGKSGGASDSVQIARPVEAECMELMPIWEAQKRNLEKITKARAQLVGVRHAIAKATFRGDTPDVPEESSGESC